MADIYKKIDDDTLEITSTHIYQREKAHLLENKRMCQDDIVRAQKEIEKIDGQLNILKVEKGA